MHPLALVSLVIGVFLLSSLSLAGLILWDWLAERRQRTPYEPFQLELQTLIDELTSCA
jgi:hypothetical protein